MRISTEMEIKIGKRAITSQKIFYVLYIISLVSSISLIVTNLCYESKFSM